MFKNVCKVKTIVNPRQYLEISKCRYLRALVCGGGAQALTTDLG